MNTRNLPNPSGNDAEAEFHRAQGRRLSNELRPKNSPYVKWNQTTQGLVPQIRLPPPGFSGGDMVDITDCATGNTYRVRGKIVIPP